MTEFEQHVVEAVEQARSMPGVGHVWLNAFKCINPTPEFAAEVGREIIAKVMAQSSNEIPILERRHVVLRINAS